MAGRRALPQERKSERAAGDGETKFHLDVDALEPIHVSATGMSEAGGFTPKDAIGIIGGCRGLNLIGADFVCFHPHIGDTRMTAFYTSSFAYEILTVPAETVRARKTAAGARPHEATAHQALGQ